MEAYTNTKLPACKAVTEHEPRKHGTPNIGLHPTSHSQFQHNAIVWAGNLTYNADVSNTWSFSGQKHAIRSFVTHHTTHYIASRLQHRLTFMVIFRTETCKSFICDSPHNTLHCLQITTQAHLHDNTVAGSQGRAQLPGSHQNGEIPGNYLSHHTKRFLVYCGHHLAGKGADRHNGTMNLVSPTSIVANVLNR